MRAFEDFNPISITVYFLSVISVVMLTGNPYLLLFSLFGAVLLFLIRRGAEGWKTHIFYSLIFAFASLINPIVSHAGVTVLFVVNDSPITLESTVFGVITSLAIISVLYWFNSFTDIMTSDKLLYVFGSLSPKLALILSMGLRYVSLFKRQMERVKATQTALGLYKEDNVIDRIKGGVRIFSVMVSWALENGIITADSMAARGYGVAKRSHFHNFTFSALDISLTVISLSLALLSLISIGLGALDFNCYPYIKMSEPVLLSYVGYVSYALLALIPVLIEAGERIKWKYLVSKI